MTQCFKMQCLITWLTSITSRKRQAATAAATVDALGAVSAEAAVLRPPRDVLRRPPPPAPREAAAILCRTRLRLLALTLFSLPPLFPLNHSLVFQTIFLK